MRTCVIINEQAGSAEQLDLLRRAFAAQEGLVCWSSTAPGEGTTLARQAVREGFGCIVAGGGDGTINEVVNGLLAAGGGAALAVLPLGTGNDLARLLDVDGDPRDALALVRAGRTVPFDAYRVVAAGRTVYGINVAAGGFSGQVDEVLTPELKANWGPLAYLIGAASVLPDLKNYAVRIALDEAPPETVDALNVIVANGRTAGGGKRVAPTANPQDGLLDVVIVKRGNVVEMGEVAARLMAGNYLESPLVLHRRARRVQITATPGMWFNVDGELLTNEPVTITVLPAALRVVVGNDFTPVPPPAGR